MSSSQETRHLPYQGASPRSPLLSDCLVEGHIVWVPIGGTLPKVCFRCNSEYMLVKELCERSEKVSVTYYVCARHKYYSRTFFIFCLAASFPATVISFGAKYVLSVDAENVAAFVVLFSTMLMAAAVVITDRYLIGGLKIAEVCGDQCAVTGVSSTVRNRIKLGCSKKASENQV
jgi:hypothetical protein